MANVSVVIFRFLNTRLTRDVLINVLIKKHSDLSWFISSSLQVAIAFYHLRQTIPVIFPWNCLSKWTLSSCLPNSVKINGIIE